MYYSAFLYLSATESSFKHMKCSFILKLMFILTKYKLSKSFVLGLFKVILSKKTRKKLSKLKEFTQILKSFESKKTFCQKVCYKINLNANILPLRRAPQYEKTTRLDPMPLDQNG